MRPSIKPLRELLAGGDRRSIGKSNRVVALVLHHPRSFGELVRCLSSDDPVVRMRAADAVEKVSSLRPQLLAPFKSELLGLVGQATQAELRWHLARILPRLPLSAAQRRRAILQLRWYLLDRSSIVKTMAIQGWFELAQGHSRLKREMGAALEDFCKTGTPAMKARSRKLLSQLHRVEKG